MANPSTERNRTIWTLTSEDGATHAKFIPEWGGVAHSWTVPFQGKPRELLYPHEHFWDPDTSRIRGGWPYLFPICGRMTRGGREEHYLLDGRMYRMPIHGFASRMPWEVVGHGAENELSMRLTDTPATREMYPFPFEVRLDYRVGPGELVCRQTVTNPGPGPMPYASGFHPYFLTPPAGAGKDSVQVDLPARRRLIYNEGLTDVAGDAPPSPMPSSVTNPAINETLNEIGEGAVCRMIYPDGLEIHLAELPSGGPPLFKYVQLYHMPEKPFFCIEHWTAHPNSLNTVDGMRWLPPNGSESASFRVWTET